MKITKYLHSCLLIEEQGKTFLIDPGNYTFENSALNIKSLKELDYLLITHEHPDHMYIPFIKEIIKKFPQLQIFSNPSVKEILGKENIIVLVEGNEFIKIDPVKHEKTFDKTPPQNVMFTLFDRFVDPGDSLSFHVHLGGVQASASLQPATIPGGLTLALPVEAPWGSTVWAVETALKVKPKIIIPIHDWHWKDEVRLGMYERLEKYFANFDIRFLKPQTGVPIEI